MQTSDFGILNCIVMVTKSKSMFSLLLQANILNNRDNLPQIQHYLAPNEGIPQIFAIFGTFLIYLTVFTCRIEVKPEYLGLDTNITANFSNNTGYTLQLQASTQLTMLGSVLGHIPMLLQQFSTAKWIASTHFL